MKIQDFLEKLIAEGMTQKEIAQKIGMFPSSFNKIIKGRKPTLETLERVSEAFNVPISTFLEEKPARIISHKEQLLLEIIDGDRDLLEEAIKHVEKEKLYKELKKSQVA